MKVFIKKRSNFKTELMSEAESWSVPLATVTGETGKLSLAENDEKEHTNDWLYIDGSVVLISQAAPQENKLQITAADASEAFDRKTIWPQNAEATYGAFIKGALERDYINCEDPAYRMSYLTVENGDSTPLVKPEMDDTQLYTLADIISQARREGVLVSFSVRRDKTAGDRLHVQISTVSGREHKILFNDGHAQLSSETYSRDSIAKVSVLQEQEAEGDTPVYKRQEFYLSKAGEISTTVPEERAEGRWEYATAGKDEAPLEKAREIFSGNINSHKIEFFSDKRYELFDTVLLRLNGAVFKTQIVYIGRSSADSRYQYKCGELAVTLTDKVRTRGTETRTYSTTVQGTPGPEGQQGPQGPKGDTGATGPQGVQGFGLLATVSREGKSENWWNTYGTIGHVESWTGTADKRNGCRIGDLFTVEGTSEEGKAHVATYRSDTESGNLHGVCIGHIWADRGATGPQGPKGDTGATGPQGPAGSDANVTAENVKTAIVTMNATQAAAAREHLGALSAAAGSVKTTNIANGAVTWDKLANDALYSHLYHVAETSYVISSKDVGRTLIDNYNIRENAIVFKLTGENSRTIPTGAEIAIAWKYCKGISVEFSGVRACDPWEGRFATASTPGTIQMAEKYETIFLKKVEVDTTYGDMWLVSGNVTPDGAINTEKLADGAVTAAKLAAAVKNSIDGKAPAYTYSQTDLTAGTSALTTGKLYFVYE